MRIFNLFKEQFKSTCLIVILFTIGFLILITLTMVFTPYFYEFTWSEQNSSGSVGGAVQLLTETTRIYGAVGILILMIFSFLLMFIMVHIDMNKGYIVNFMSLPITRFEILISKIINLIFSLFIISVIVMVYEMLISIMYKDVDGNAMYILFKLNFGLFMYGLFISSTALIIYIWVDRFVIASIIFLSIHTIFLILNIVWTMPQLNVNFLGYINPATLWDYKTLLVKNDFSYLWKYFVLLIISIPEFVGSLLIFNKKDLSI